MTSTDETKRCDLHCHSSHSDGTSDPRELLEQAERASLAGLALTDHDTISGLPEARDEARRRGITLLTGVEISSHCGDEEIHILGYGFDGNCDELQNMLDLQKQARKRRIPTIVEKLRALGIELALEEVLREAGNAAPGRPHVAQTLVAKGHCRSVQEVFDRYLKDNGPANVPKETVGAKRVIEVLKSAGGLAVLAHPLARPIRRFGGLEALLRTLRDFGLDGVEVQHPAHSTKDRKRIAKLARRFELLATGGSDAHGKNSPGIKLGQGRGDIDVPLATLHEILARTSPSSP